MNNTMSTTRKTKELIYDPTIVLNEKKFIEGLSQPFKKQRKINEETSVHRCIGGCGKIVSNSGGMCGVAGGGIPACHH